MGFDKASTTVLVLRYHGTGQLSYEQEIRALLILLSRHASATRYLAGSSSFLPQAPKKHVQVPMYFTRKWANGRAQARVDRSLLPLSQNIATATPPPSSLPSSSPYTTLSATYNHTHIYHSSKKASKVTQQHHTTLQTTHPAHQTPWLPVLISCRSRLRPSP